MNVAEAKANLARAQAEATLASARVDEARREVARMEFVAAQEEGVRLRERFEEVERELHAAQELAAAREIERSDCENRLATHLTAEPQPTDFVKPAAMNRWKEKRAQLEAELLAAGQRKIEADRWCTPFLIEQDHLRKALDRAERAVRQWQLIAEGEAVASGWSGGVYQVR